MSTAPAFASETDALQMLDSALGYLAAADPTQMPTLIQARCLIALERADARTTAARASILPHSAPAKATGRTRTIAPAPGSSTRPA